ncbi:MAG: GNAT family N-acetyltransferase [Beijerinckiaceae bacterium]
MAGLDIVISPERASDAQAVQHLEERAFGPGRYVRSAYRLREGNPHDPALSFVARVSTLVVGSIRLSRIRIGERPALLLGPLTVDPAFRSKGIGRMLIDAAIEAARAAGHAIVLLVGDEAYYGRAGFVRLRPGTVRMPGPVDPMRVLALGLTEGALDGLTGDVRTAR